MACGNAVKYSVSIVNLYILPWKVFITFHVK